MEISKVSPSEMRRRTGEASGGLTGSASLKPRTLPLWQVAQCHEVGGLDNVPPSLLDRIHIPPVPAPLPSVPGVRSSSRRPASRHAAFPALPDGVGDALDTDAVGGLCQGLRLACLPTAAAPLQGGRPSARHPWVLGLRGLLPSLTLLARCPTLPPPCLVPPPCPALGRGSSLLSPGRSRSLPSALATQGSA